MHKNWLLSACCCTMIPLSGFAVDLNTAIQNTKTACSGISDSMHDLKVKAGITTAVTAVGTVAGGVALGTGIAKSKVDDVISVIEMYEGAKGNDIDNQTVISLTVADIDMLVNEAVGSEKTARRISELEEKSKTLGNIRTGTLAASTATNVAGTVLSATNKVDGDFEAKINTCIASIKELEDAKMAARLEQTASAAELEKADKIHSACREYEYIDLTPINKRGMGAAIASGIGAGTGVVGTITSAIANTDQTRAGDAEKEKNLNTTANVMAGASTVASATATILNGTQIAAIKKVSTVADECEEALK